MKFVVLLDIGGTFLKGTIVSDDTSQRHEVIRRPGPSLILSHRGEALLDPRQLQVAVESLCRDLVSTTKGKLEGIFFTGQMHGVVLTDLAGEPATDVITWRDSLPCRVDEVDLSAAQVVSSMVPSDRLEDLGNELREGLPIATLLARKSRGQETDGFVPHSLISFCATSLTHFSNSPMMHVTDAAAHGFLNIADSKWDLEVLNNVGLGGLILPQVVSDVVSCGFSREFNCPVYVAVGDQQSALYGMKLSEEDVSLNIATGSQVSRLVSEPTTVAQLRPYFDGKFLSTVTHIPAGRALNVLVNLVTELSAISSDEAWDLISQRTLVEEKSSLDIDLSFFPSATGSVGHISNISESNLTVAQIFKSAVEAMAHNYLAFSRLLDPAGSYESVVISGGLATRFTPLMDAIKVTFGSYAYRISATDDASLDGLRRIAAITLNS